MNISNFESSSTIEVSANSEYGQINYVNEGKFMIFFEIKAFAQNLADQSDVIASQRVINYNFPQNP